MRLEKNDMRILAHVQIIDCAADIINGWVEHTTLDDPERNEIHFPQLFRPVLTEYLLNFFEPVTLIVLVAPPVLIPSNISSLQPLPRG
jgi:hypothetical protein